MFGGRAGLAESQATGKALPRLQGKKQAQGGLPWAESTNHGISIVPWVNQGQASPCEQSVSVTASENQASRTSEPTEVWSTPRHV